MEWVSIKCLHKKRKDTLESHNAGHKSKELEPLKMLILYEKNVAEKLKRIANKYEFTTDFIKIKDLRGQLRTEQEDEMETSGVVYEIGCNKLFKK